MNAAGRTKVVVLGGTGHFGGRICRRLQSESGIDLVVTSRRLALAEAFCRTLSPAPGSSVIAQQLDHQAPDLATRLQALDADIVVHTAGPFQGQNYHVASACVAAGCHYIDLADGREFVAGFAELDTSAREADVLLVSGASTLPGLSGAIVAAYLPAFARLHEIEIVIAPAQQTPRGAGTVAAVLGYCGKPIALWRRGQWQLVHGWQDLRTINLRDLGRRFSAACDVPDLTLFPAAWPDLETVTFHAALESRVEHVALLLMAGLVRMNLVRDWSRFTPLFTGVSRWWGRLGSQTGGMQIRLSGQLGDGATSEQTWHLTARNNHGPEIPCAPALILTRRLVKGIEERRGAMPCMGLISLADFAAEVADLDIVFDRPDLT